MAQLLLVSEKTVQVPGKIKRVWDVVGIYEDSHQFDPHEHKVYDVVRVKGISARSLNSWLRNNTKKKTRTVFRLPVGNQWTDSEPEQIEVWKDGDTWRKVEDDYRQYTLNGAYGLFQPGPDGVFELSIAEAKNNIKDWVSLRSRNQKRINVLEGASRG